jgi:hypothetical protein
MAEACVLLTLNKAEAETLADILFYVDGSPKNSRRRHAESLLAALATAGVETDSVDRRMRDLDPIKKGTFFNNSR